MAIAILMPLFSVKLASSQPPVKQYVAVDVEVFEEMQKTATQLRTKLREIEDLEKQIATLRKELEKLKERVGTTKKPEASEDEDFYF